MPLFFLFFNCTKTERCGCGGEARQEGEGGGGGVQAVAGLLVVAPEALLGLVDGSLRLSHQAALPFIRLREDFKSARLPPRNITLAQQFSEE